MSEKYPHLNDNSFPDLNTRVYSQYNNTFDYGDYEDNKTILKPCNVRWTNESNDRVYWKSDDERNEWFDNLKSPIYTTDYISGLNYVGGSEIKLPIPYQALQRFNYLMVIVPDTPIDNNVNPVKRLFYHIVSTDYATASVTNCVLELDAFTTYQHDVTISRIDLNRGHYPMKLTDVDSYLSNPMENNEGLLSIENNTPDIGNIVSNTMYYSFGADDLMVCFALRCSLNDIKKWNQSDLNKSEMTPPIYGDATAYYGKQYNVDGYRWATNGDYSNVNNPFTNQPSYNERPNGYLILCGSAVDIYNQNDINKNILEYCTNYYPQFYSAVEAMFIVPKALINVDINSVVSLGNFKLYKASNKYTNETVIRLDRSMFNYSKEYANITKLYTTPYSAIKFVNMVTNNIALFNIQDFSNNVKITKRCSIMYPYLNAQILLSGIGNNNTFNFQWKDMTNKSNNTPIPESSYNFTYNYDIPTFELMVDNTVLYYLSNYNNTANISREKALNTYHNMIRSGNTNTYNTEQSINRTLNNTLHSNTLIHDNTIRSANTVKTNIDESADIMVSNTALSINNASYINGRKNSLSNDIIVRQNYVADWNCVDNNNHMAYQRVQIHDNMSLTAAVQNTSTRALTANDNASSYLSASSGAIATAAGITIGAVATAAGLAAAPVTGGASAAAAVAGVSMAASAATQGVSAFNSMANTLVGAAKNDTAAEIVCNTNNSLTSYTQTMNENITSDAITTNVSIKNRTNEANTYINNRQTTVSTEITDNSNNTSRSITDNNARLARANAIRTNNVAVTNANDVKTVNDNNANFIANTNIENNNRSQETNIDIAKRQLELAQRCNNWQRADMSRSRNTTVAQSNGNATYDIYANNGILMQVVTQPTEIIKRCGDNFLRYGYTYGHTVESPNLLVCNNFTYWEGDALIYSDNAPLIAVNSIRDLFARGLTVWSNAGIIGGSIYDNKVL